MSYLNWKESNIAIELNPVSHQQMQMSLKWTQVDRSGFIQAFKEIQPQVNQKSLSSPSHQEELRIGFANDWVLFWKLREFGSRALLAHPEKDIWIGTIALTFADAKKWTTQLETLPSGESLSLSRCLVLDTVSNLDLVISMGA